MTHQPPHHMTTANQPDSNDIIAIILSVFLPGVGHIMLGQVTKGIVILVATFVTCGLGYIFSVIVALDAYMVAMARKNRPVDDWEFFPK